MQPADNTMSFVVSAEGDSHNPREILGSLSGNELNRPLNTSKKKQIPKLLCKTQSSMNIELWRELKMLIHQHISDSSYRSRALDIIVALEQNNSGGGSSGPHCNEKERMIATPRTIEKCHEIISELRIASDQISETGIAEGKALTETEKVVEGSNLQTYTEIPEEPLSVARRRQRRASVSPALFGDFTASPAKTTKGKKRRDQKAKSRKEVDRTVDATQGEAATPVGSQGSITDEVAESNHAEEVEEGPSVPDINVDEDDMECGVVHWDMPPSRFATPDTTEDLDSANCHSILADTQECTKKCAEQLLGAGGICEPATDITSPPALHCAIDPLVSASCDTLTASSDPVQVTTSEACSDSLVVAEEPLSVARRRQRRASVSPALFGDFTASPAKTTKGKKRRDQKAKSRKEVDRTVDATPVGSQGSITDEVAESNHAEEVEEGPSVPDINVDEDDMECGVVHWDMPPSRHATPDTTEDVHNLCCLSDKDLHTSTCTRDWEACPPESQVDNSVGISPSVLKEKLYITENSALDSLMVEDTPRAMPRRRQRRASASLALWTDAAASPSKARRTKTGSSRSMKAREMNVAVDSLKEGINEEGKTMGATSIGSSMSQASGFPDIEIEEVEHGIVHWDGAGSYPEIGYSNSDLASRTANNISVAVRKSPRKNKAAIPFQSLDETEVKGESFDHNFVASAEVHTFSSLVGGEGVAAGTEVAATTPPREALTRKCFTHIMGPEYIDEAVVAVWVDKVPANVQHFISSDNIKEVWNALGSLSERPKGCESLAYATFVLALATALGREKLQLSDLEERFPELDSLQMALMAFSNEACDGLLDENSCPQSVGSARRIRFAGLVGECVSPPNDRKPGSSVQFQDLAKKLELLMDCIAAVVHSAVHNHQSRLAHIVEALGDGLACLANDKDLCNAAVCACQEVPSWTFGRRTLGDLSKMSRILCGEFGLKYMSYNMMDEANLYESPQSLYLPGRLRLGHRRTALRHRITWVITSVLRYYLRWLLDEIPLRAATVQLIGPFPSVSCRSEAVPRLAIVPSHTELSMYGGAPRISAPLEMTISSMLNLALQQIYLGLFECAKSSAPLGNDILCGWSVSSDRDIFYSSLQMAGARLHDWITETLDNSHEDQNGRLRCCQTALAAERGRAFVHNLLSLSVVQNVGASSNVWSVIEKYSSSLLSHGLPEDYHFSLLSNISCLQELVSTPFILSSEVMALATGVVHKRYNSKNTSKDPSQKALNTEAMEMIHLCPYVYEFPAIKEI